MMIQSACVSGSAHQFKMELCQDAVYGILDSDGIHSIALCDGCGGSRYGGIAAKITSGMICRLLITNFKRYLSMSPKDIKEEISTAVYNDLLFEAQRRNIPPYLLAATILAAAVNEEGQLISVHLGDGESYYISSQQIGILSSPRNGATADLTYLTMNCQMAEELRFYRWLRKGEISSVILMSDGMQKMLPESWSLNDLKICIGNLSAMDHIDDASVILMER